MTDKDNIDEVAREYYRQVSDSVKSIYELQARMDERLQNITKKQDETDKKIDYISTSLNELSSRMVSIEAEDIKDTKKKLRELELKVQSIETETNRQASRWKDVFSFVVQLIWVIVAAYVLVKLGLQSPSTP